MSGSNRLSGLKARPKDTTVEEVRRVDDVGEARGSLIERHERSPAASLAPALGNFTRRFSRR